MIKLRMSFLNSEGKTQNLEPRIVSTELTAETVRTAMEGLRDLALFEKNDVQLYQEVKGAKYVQTIEIPLFED